MIPELNDYDWMEVLKYASGETTPCGNVGYISANRGYNGPTDYFEPEDVAAVIALKEGEPDGDDWLGVFRLHDGRFAFICAGCDYTGWD